MVADTTFSYFEYCFCFMNIMFFWETYLDWRQHQRFSVNAMDTQLKGIVSEDDWKKAQAYGHDKSTFHFLSSGVNHFQSMSFLWFGLYPFLWEWSAQLVTQATGETVTGNSHESLVFIFALYLVESVTSLPFSAYSTFVVEEKHGFNKTDLYTFVTDFFKQIGLVYVRAWPMLTCSLFFGTLCLPPFIWIIKWGGEHFYIYVWVFLFALQIFLITIFPTYIQPLFNKVEELEPGSLRTKIEALAVKTGFPLTKLFKIDGSKRSGHSNAYFYGFFKNKRIVLYDTLIEQSSEEEVVAVLGHELGHYFLNHTIQINMFSMFYLYGFMMHNEELFQSFGFSSNSVIISFTLFTFIYAPISHVLQFAMNLWSRRNEFQADAFSAKLGYCKELKSGVLSSKEPLTREGLIKLQTANLSTMSPDPWYSTYHYSHPPLVERLRAIEEERKVAKTK